MEMRLSSEDMVFLCRLMQLLHQLGTLALRNLLIKSLFVRYIQSRRATFTYFADKQVVVTDHVTGGGSGYSTKYRVPNPLPDIEKCVKDSKDGGALLNYIEETFLTETVNNNLTKLANLTKRKVMNKVQWETLFSNATVTIHDLDLTLLSLLLFNLFNFKPTADMKTLPLSGIISEADDVLRLRIYRNKIAHLKSLEITPKEFEDMWKDISCAVIRLLGSAYQNDMNRLKITNFDEAAVIRYEQLRKEWSQTVTEIYQSLSDIQEELRSIKKRPKHRKGVAIQLVNSDDLHRALTVLKKKGITTKVISLDETDSDSSDSLVETVTNRKSKSAGCLELLDYVDGEDTIRAYRSSTHLESETLRAKEMAEPFHVMFPGNETNNTSNDPPRRWSLTDSRPGLTGESTTFGCHSVPSTSSCDSLFEDNKDKDELPQQKDGRVGSARSCNGLETHRPDKVPEIDPKTKRKSFWRSFKGLF
ncbi:uncharacterized protein LOC110465397 [Mizuhopecten yessoensis]|uniref:DZIP3-like HEPN domain-containing protein n=1 Tax=Mizuhopecten yessoensis TaxID=6573 RepID=A0A210PRR2_MIZYE|nr:uncharacterized protein LOC110465397 [Mizuhopecten yessoensis]OWF39185.1 hypothetical protein KP79_PYT07188 [Mizuhopecten yessoensis]